MIFGNSEVQFEPAIWADSENLFRISTQWQKSLYQEKENSHDLSQGAGWYLASWSSSSTALPQRAKEHPEVVNMK